MTIPAVPLTSMPDPALFDRVNASFSRQGLMRHLGVQLHAVEPGQAILRLPFGPGVTQQHGYFHGGATGALADTAGGYAAYTVFPENSAVMSVEFKINFLAPAQGDYLEAVGRVIRSGRTLTVCQVDVYGVSPEKRSHVAMVQQTLVCLPDASNPG
ncbi:MAG: PaaI family thioesterase [Burkholderiaceae bacterium]|jgi:uncharacterized protein (TIGR00369 family)